MSQPGASATSAGQAAVARLASFEASTLAAAEKHARAQSAAGKWPLDPRLHTPVAAGAANGRKKNGTTGNKSGRRGSSGNGNGNNRGSSPSRPSSSSSSRPSSPLSKSMTKAKLQGGAEKKGGDGDDDGEAEAEAERNQTFTTGKNFVASKTTLRHKNVSVSECVCFFFFFPGC